MTQTHEKAADEPREAVDRAPDNVSVVSTGFVVLYGSPIYSGPMGTLGGQDHDNT